MNKFNKKVVLLVMDGWGLSEPSEFNAIDNAKKPNYERLVREFPNTRLKSDGLAVGLPEGQFGTSEVNHMTIGAGRVIFQDLPKINKAIEDGTFYSNRQILASIDNAVKHNGDMHLVGLLSDGGIHSTTGHLFALLETLSREKFQGNVYLHLFTDGRDTPPKSADKYFLALTEEMAKHENLKVSIATIQGRFYLDRDRDWDKTEKAAQLILNGEGKSFSDWVAVLNFEYNQNITDEFFTQYVINQESKVKPGDSVIFFHYRTDRLYQIAKRIIDEKIENLSVTTFISVSEEFNNVLVAFPREKIEHTLAETISKAYKSQLHITETEKYPHLTFFLNGEKEQEYPLEEWKMIQSNRYVKPHYNFEPSMRNFEITQQIVESINEDKYDFIIANLSSPDMVGHTGNYHAAIISAESVDYCLGKIHEAIKDNLDNYALIITSDHGNSDQMWDFENDQPHTQHTTANVPFILVTNINCKLHRRDTLQDIAPTVLDLMGIEKPEVMQGESLIIVEE
jgi:2,3-bisphosphoglycerate-independent phosphoglycerate mutase